MRDEELLRRVLLRTNGANIHDVNGMLGAYNASCEFEDAYSFWARAVLSQFADTGDIKQAKKDWKEYLPKCS